MDQQVTDALGRYTDEAVELSMAYGPKLLLALVTLVIGLWLIRMVNRAIDKGMESASVEPTLHRFLHSLANIMLKGVLFVSVITMIGVETTSIIAMLGAVGLGVGLALQGSLANFAGGILILFFKPFMVDDVIEAQGYTGIVDEIQIFNTILRTLDNQRVIIPNGLLSNGCVKNLFAETTRRVDLVYGVSYTDDIAHVRSVLEKVVAADSRVLKDPAHDLFLAEHGESSINFYLRLWVNSEDYWPVHFGTQEAVKLAFDAEGISIPFPQRDVHFFPTNGAAAPS